MNIGWVFLICALIVLGLMAFAPWRRKERVEESTRVEGGSLSGEVERLLIQGKKIQAIKLYREQTGLGLREAKEAVDALERELRQGGTAFAQAGEQTAEAGRNRAGIQPSGEEVRRLVLEGKKIQAIKLYREQMGVGLREAKEAVEALESGLRQGSAAFVQADEQTAEAERNRAGVEPSGEEIQRLILKGDKIRAIKLYREQTGVGLREAKTAIDHLERTLRYGLEQA